MNIIKSLVLFALALTLQLTFALQGVNLNTATQAELEALPGVGAKLASEIIAKRPFQSVDALKDVKGVGDAKFNKLKGLVVVTPAVAASAPTAPTATASAPAAAAPAMTAAAANVKAASGKLTAGEKVSLNNGSVDQLEKLPGIGPQKAQAIIQARPFTTIEDVMKVKGIKAGIFNKIKNNLSL